MLSDAFFFQVGRTWTRSYLCIVMEDWIIILTPWSTPNKFPPSKTSVQSICPYFVVHLDVSSGGPTSSSVSWDDEYMSWVEAQSTKMVWFFCTHLSYICA